jgi:ParB-like chromosome segregation protein Spo0J
MPTAPLNQLKPHPAQMRTSYDLESLASLTLQIYERGLNEWQPIVASARPGANGAEGSDGYHIISGHRRHMAQLLAFALRDWATQRPDEEVDIEVVRTLLDSLIDTCGSLADVITFLLDQYGSEEVAFVPFAGSDKAQVLALQAANYGSEQPDLLGIAHSFRQAVEAGATAAEIARNVGQHVAYVTNHLALSEVPPELAQRIADGDFPMSVAAAVADLPEPKRSGLAIFVLANEPGQITAKAIKACAATLKKWPGLQMPLMVKHQAQRNIARALVNLWQQVVEAYPADAYAAAAMLIHRDLHDAPWANQEKLTFWFRTLGGDSYFAQGQIHWANVIAHLLADVSCRTCPIAQLPTTPLQTDLAQGNGGPLGMPCRSGGHTIEDHSRCIHGLAPNDPFDVRVPWEWSDHPGVAHEEGEYRVKRYEDLLAAWQAQEKEEGRQQKEEETAAAESTNTTTTATAADAPSDITVDAQVAPPESDEVSVAATTGTDSSPAAPQKESPIVKQRAKIAAFMQTNEQLAAGHPFATPCATCRHRLDASPTKDPDVPHCVWAGRLRTVSFKQLQPTDGNGPVVLVCRQYAPTQPWSETIPAHVAPPDVPRDWLKAQILHLAEAGNRHQSGHNVFEFLTGRPLSSSENYGDWFRKQFESQIGDLSDAQLFTLFIWSHSEWQRARRREFLLPVNGSGVQFATYKEAKWRSGEVTT